MIILFVIKKCYAKVLQENNIGLAVDRINNFMNDMHRCARRPKCTTIIPNNTKIMDTANEKFKIYSQLSTNGSEEEIKQSLEDYQQSKKG